MDSRFFRSKKVCHTLRHFFDAVANCINYGTDHIHLLLNNSPIICPLTVTSDPSSKHQPKHTIMSDIDQAIASGGVNFD